LVSPLADVPILIVSRLRNLIVAVNLIVVGLLGLFGDMHLREAGFRLEGCAFSERC